MRWTATAETPMPPSLDHMPVVDPSTARALPNPPIADADHTLAFALFGRVTLNRLNLATIRHTAFRSFVDLCVDPGGAPWYRPTLRGLPKLADAYDRFQSARGDSRRAFRGL